MYFPYLRAKTFDYQALRQINHSLYKSNKLLPIIESATISKTAIADLCKKGLNFIFITNPYVGGSKEGAIQDLKSNVFASYNCVTLGFNINEHTSQNALNDFLTSDPTYKKALIFHGECQNVRVLNLIWKYKVNIDWLIFIENFVDQSYIDSFKGFNRVLIQDCFQKQEKNADYPALSTFSDLYSRYTSEGYQGFGDFMTLSYEFTTGFAPRCVAIHLSKYFRKGREIQVQHFLSDDTSGIENVSGKYGQAHDKLIAYLDANPRIDTTTGTAMFRDATDYPGLGTVKKMSLIHHIELIHSLI
jgi:hypothetical protein